MQRVFYAVLALCVFAASASAQTTAGRLVGTVSSPDADAGYGGAQVRLVTPRGQSSFHGA